MVGWGVCFRPLVVAVARYPLEECIRSVQVPSAKDGLYSEVPVVWRLVSGICVGPL